MNDFPLHSSVLSGYRYDPDHEELWLRFRTGDLYLYRTVPATVAKALLEARSHCQIAEVTTITPTIPVGVSTPYARVLIE
jgi:hypothetical protein